MITNSSRNAIDLSVNGRAVRIECEALLPGHGSPDFVAYRNTLRTWADGDQLTEDEKELILADLQSSAKARGWTVEVE
jgi:hypothetical protein